MAAIANTHQQLSLEAAQLQQSFISLEQSIAGMPFQKQWHACEQIHKMQAQFHEFLSKVESSLSFQNDPSIRQTRGKLEQTSKRVSTIYDQIKSFNHWYGVINEDLRTYQSTTTDPRSADTWLNAQLEIINKIRLNAKDNGCIDRAFQQLAEKLTSALRLGQSSLNPSNPLTDSLVEQLNNEKRRLDRTDFGDSIGEFNTYLPFFEKLRKTAKDHPDLKEQNLTFIKIYTGTYFQITNAISMHHDNLWAIPRPRLLEESREMTKSLTAVIDRTNWV